MKMEPIKAPFDRIRTYSSMTEFLEKNGNRIMTEGGEERLNSHEGLLRAEGVLEAHFSLFGVL